MIWSVNPNVFVQTYFWWQHVELLIIWTVYPSLSKGKCSLWSLHYSFAYKNICLSCLSTCLGNVITSKCFSVPGGTKCHLSPLFSHESWMDWPNTPQILTEKFPVLLYQIIVTWPFLKYSLHVSMSPTDNYLQTENTTDLGYCLMNSLDGMLSKHCVNCTGPDSRF